MVSFVGIVFDGKRNAEGDYELNKCSVFGITKEVVVAAVSKSRNIQHQTQSASSKSNV